MESLVFGRTMLAYVVDIGLSLLIVVVLSGLMYLLWRMLQEPLPGDEEIITRLQQAREEQDLVYRQSKQILSETTESHVNGEFATG